MRSVCSIEVLLAPWCSATNRAISCCDTDFRKARGPRPSIPRAFWWPAHAPIITSPVHFLALGLAIEELEYAGLLDRVRAMLAVHPLRAVQGQSSLAHLGRYVGADSSCFAGAAATETKTYRCQMDQFRRSDRQGKLQGTNSAQILVCLDRSALISCKGPRKVTLRPSWSRQP